MPSLHYDVLRTFEALDCFRSKITADLSASGAADSTVSAIELSVYEVIANIIEHESVDDSAEGSAISVDCVTGTHIICTLKWRGNEFDITGSPLPDLETHFSEGKKDGLGLYIIHTLMDRLRYRHDGKFSIFTMEKNASGEQR